MDIILHLNWHKETLEIKNGNEGTMTAGQKHGSLKNVFKVFYSNLFIASVWKINKEVKIKGTSMCREFKTIYNIYFNNPTM